MKTDYKGITITIDRECGTRVDHSLERYAELMKVLEPFKKRGLRYRVAVAPSTVKRANVKRATDPQGWT